MEPFDPERYSDNDIKLIGDLGIHDRLASTPSQLIFFLAKVGMSWGEAPGIPLLGHPFHCGLARGAGDMPDSRADECMVSWGEAANN